MKIRLDKIEAKEIRSIYKGNWIDEYYVGEKEAIKFSMQILQEILLLRGNEWYLPDILWR